MPRWAIAPALRVLVGWTASLVLLPSIVLVLLLTPAQHRRRLGPALARVWGRLMLAICAIRLEITPAARSAMAERHARILTLNHTSTLDVVVGGALYPRHCVTVAKAEFRRTPIIGPAGALVGMIFIDRSDGRGARASLLAAIDRIHREELVVLIAPEGTRSRDGAMPAFRTGAFALAQAGNLPITPLVWHGVRALWPMGAFGPRAGTVVIDALPTFTVPPGDDAPKAAAVRLRTDYMRALGIQEPLGAAEPEAPSAT